MITILEKYIELLWAAFQYDMDVFSQGWLYYWLLVPAVAYLGFFFLKWTVLTTPVWLPVALALSPFGRLAAAGGRAR